MFYLRLLSPALKQLKRPGPPCDRPRRASLGGLPVVYLWLRVATACVHGDLLQLAVTQIGAILGKKSKE